MRPFEPHCPTGPDWTLDWDATVRGLPWLAELDGVPQDPVHHAEGDVAVHTRMAAEALAADPAWRRLEPARRLRLFAAVLLHDVGKRDCTVVGDDGRVTAHGHSRRGELVARRLLWEAGVPAADREHVAALIRHHQLPFWALEREDLDRIVFASSLTTRNDDLAVLARADITGRICRDAERVLENIALFEEYCDDRGCLDTPRDFPSDHARFQYFRTPGRDPGHDAYDDTVCTVTVMSGLPGSGKDTWVAHHRPDLPVVALDDIRAELGIHPGENQGPVVAAARERVRVLLRAGTSLVWNATTLSRRSRDAVIGLAAAYRARVEIVAVETTPAELRRRNRDRPDTVPAAVVERMLRRWESPDLTEAHRVTRPGA
ncbi:putative kinase [Stackebrandtia albiflava]|uniref:Putative kinase n=1 Tax=Stackebrandtia albiflava TaxID=406432 RepID=A0A562V1H9_9ACTN|nr:AAA family ATPase [Stackebrandtia albiflava]TWJ11769.1 putative kinase [Stackebrandtia albiflava]